MHRSHAKKNGHQASKYKRTNKRFKRNRKLIDELQTYLWSCYKKKLPFSLCRRNEERYMGQVYGAGIDEINEEKNH